MNFEDSLSLKPSDVIAITSDSKINESLTLDAAPAILGGTVSGTVYDTTLSGAVLGGATLTVFNSAGNIVATGTSSLLGIYSISGLENGTTYTIVASKDGYNTSAAQSFTPTILVGAIVNLVITPNTNEDLNTVFGIVKDETDNPIESVVVTLTNKTTSETYSSTATISDGEYAIYNIPTGSYSLMATKSGFFSTNVDTITLTSKDNSKQDLTLEEDASSGSGVISGIITDTNSDVVPNAFVGLYEVNSSDEPETLIDYTFSNSAGRYVFSNVSAGSYIVKAKLSE